MADEGAKPGAWDGNIETLPAAQWGPWKLPIPGVQPPLANKVDYEALRQKRMAEVDEETRLINLPFAQQPREAPPPPMHVLAPELEARNVEIPGPDGPLQMRLYFPRDRGEKVGLYFHTHGGGWCMFDGLENCDTENSIYAKDFGCAVAQVDFRVSWKAKFPAAVEDCFAAYKWVVEHADELGLDRTRIGIGGGCTGANLATVVALMARDAGIQKPAVQWLWTPVFDARNNTQSYEEFANYSLTQAQAEAVTRLYLRSKEDSFDWRASPILADTFEGMSPAVIWAGEWEVLRSESREFAARAKEAGVDVTYIEGKQQPHAGIYAINPKTGKPSKYSTETVPEVHGLIRRYIGPRT